MTRMIEERRFEIEALCRQHGVRKLSVFGSGTREDFDSAKSDLDFLVEFQPLNPREHKEAYFRLTEALGRLFSRGVDLIEMHTVRNPYLRSRIEQEQETVYDAA
jgi:predicted nucleotidyltransferase